MRKILGKVLRGFCVLVQDELCPSLPQWAGLIAIAAFLSIGIWQAIVMGSLWPLGAGMAFAAFGLALAWPLADGEEE